MKKRGSFLVFFLPYITAGIYLIYWLVVTRRDLVKQTNVKVPSVWILFSPLLLMAAVLIFLVAVAGGRGIEPGSDTARVVNTITILLELIAVVATFVIAIYWYWRLGKAVEAYTKGQMSAPAALALILLFGLIGFGTVGFAIIQDSLNNATDEQRGTTTLAQPMQPLMGAPMQTGQWQQPMQPMGPQPIAYGQPMQPQYPQPGYSQPAPAQPMYSQPVPPADPSSYGQPMSPQAPYQQPAPQIDQYGNPVQPPQYPPAGPQQF